MKYFIFKAEDVKLLGVNLNGILELPEIAEIQEELDEVSSRFPILQECIENKLANESTCRYRQAVSIDLETKHQ